MYYWVAFPLLRITLLFVIGIVLAIELPPPVCRSSIVLGLAGLFIIYLLVWWYERSEFYRLNLLFGITGHLLIVMCGYATLLFHNDQYDPNHLLHRQGIIAYQVKIIDEAEDKEKSIRLSGELISVKDSTGWSPATGRTLMYIKKEYLVDQRLTYGDVLLIRGSPNRLQPPKNPGEFDYRQYLSYQNIYHQDFIRSGEFTILKRQQGFLLYCFALKSRTHLKNILYQYITGERERVIALALLLGTRHELTPQINQAYASAGAMHILAVSGLHVGIIYSLMLLCLKKFQNGKLMKWVVLLLMLSGLWSYALLTGLSPSVLRATMMASLITIAKVGKRQGNIYNTLSAAGLILLCVDPYMLMSVGFQLSFLAVFAIAYITPRLYGLMQINQYVLDKMWAVTCVSIAAQIATLPLVLLYFHQFPTYFIVTNLVVIPAAFLILSSGIALFALEIIPYINDLIGWMLESLIYLTNEFIFLIKGFPHNTIEDLYIDSTQCYLIIASIVLFCGWTYYKQFYQFIMLLLVVWSFVFIGQWRTVQNLQNKEIVFYSIGGHTAIDLIEGDRVAFIADSALINDARKINFHIRAKRLQAGIHHTTPSGNQLIRKKIGTNELIIWNKQSILILKEYSSVVENMKVDVLLVANNSIYNRSQLAKIHGERIVINGSNSRKRRAMLRREAQKEGISIIDLTEQGAYTMVL